VSEIQEILTRFWDQLIARPSAIHQFMALGRFNHRFPRQTMGPPGALFCLARSSDNAER
jgi:hypothetical protein